MNVIVTAIQFLVLGGALVGAYVWWKSQPPAAEKEYQRGYDDARHFHAKGVNAWSMKGFIDCQRAANLAGPYEEGMLSYINEILKTELK